MARRSPLNKRYQKDVKLGSTRKSAAAAKPKRSNAAPGSSSPAKKSTRSSGSRYQAVELPPDVKRLQKISFALLGVAVVISVLYLWQNKALGSAGSILLGIAYACMFTALYIDFAKVRPVLKAIRKGEAPPSKTNEPAAKKKPEKSKADNEDSGAPKGSAKSTDSSDAT